MKCRLWCLFAFMVLVGCGLFSDGEVELTTDEGQYSLDTNTTITVTVANGTEADIYYICTGQIFLEEIQANELKGSWMVHGFEECYSAISIEAGKDADFQIDLGQLVTYGMLGGAVFDESVTYRLLMDLFEDDQFESLVSDGQRRTAVFQIIQENP
jgi:hypothetical protein